MIIELFYWAEVMSEANFHGKCGVEVQEKLWLHKEIPDSEIDKLAAEAGISRLLARVFVSRGIIDADYIKSFLHPNMKELNDPFLMRDMDLAADRIISALSGGEHIVIFGDYDVDGITSTSVLYDFLVSQGGKVDYYIPDRMDDGYGLSKGALDKVREMGAELILTVDCGITAVEELEYINSCGMQAIITDHHECKDILPRAYAVVNPCRPDCSYPFRELAGVGVVFKLVQALCSKLNRGELWEKYLDLVTLGTVADVVPLLKENRLIVKFGLQAVEESANPGIRALLEVAGLTGKPVTTYGAGFALAPRINAAGRIGSAMRAVKLFTTDDTQLAMTIAQELDAENRFRQETETEILQQVVSYIEEKIDIEKDKVIVVCGSGWHHGIIGIVASRITDRYHRPTILISEENGIGKGSGRSVEGFNLFKALVHCGELLDKFGGHELAAGLSLKTENTDEFRRRINSYADSVLSVADLLPCLKIDAFIEKEDVTIQSISDLELMAPFGAGNPGPVFAYEGLRINDIRTVGDNRHLKLKLEDGGMYVDAIGFNMGELAGCFTTADMLDSVFTLEINTWNNVRKPQLNLRDVRPSREKFRERSTFFNLDKYIVFNGSDDYNINIGGLQSLGSYRLEQILPERSDLAAVYQYIRAFGRNRASDDGIVHLEFEDLFKLAGNISERCGIHMDYFKLKRCIEIFEELKLLKKELSGVKGMYITLFDPKVKVNLDDSLLFRKLSELRNQLLKEAK